jgi:hypothetical protein
LRERFGQASVTQRTPPELVFTRVLSVMMHPGLLSALGAHPVLEDDAEAGGSDEACQPPDPARS